MSQLFPPRALQYSANVYHCAHPTRGQKAKKTLACDKNRAKEGQAMNLRAKKQLTCNPSFTYLQRDNKISANLFDKILTMWIAYVSVPKGVFIYPKSKIILVILTISFFFLASLCCCMSKSHYIVSNNSGDWGNSMELLQTAKDLFRTGHCPELPNQGQWRSFLG